MAYVLDQEVILTPEVKEKQTATTKIIFKELDDEDEILEMFALRSLVYQYVNFFSSTGDGDQSFNALDVDCYDPYSTFLGAIEITGHSRRIVGTVRIISGDKETRHAPLVKTIYGSQPGSNNNGFLKRPKRFPHLETFDVPSEYYSSFFGDNGSIGKSRKYDDKPYEISRLAVLPEYWKTKARIELGLHIMIILSSWRAQPTRNSFIIAVHPKTKRLYERIGFTVIPDTSEKMYKGINQPAILMQLNLNKYLEQSNPYIDICSAAFENYMRKGYYMHQERA